MEIDIQTYDFYTTCFLLGVTLASFLWVFLERKRKSLLPFLVIAFYSVVLLLVGVNEYRYATRQEAVIMEELGFFEGTIDPEEQAEVDPDIWIDSQTSEGIKFEIINEETRQQMRRNI